jgi:capsular polysaccharide transport system permease protein
MVAPQEDSSIAANSTESEAGGLRATERVSAPKIAKEASDRGNSSLTTVARRLGGFRFKKSTGEYVLARGFTPLDETASGGGSGRLLFGSFFLLVVFPSLIAFFYYFLVASDVYVAETKLTVRAATASAAKSTTMSGGASSIIGKLGLGQSGSPAQDSRIILDYLRSRAAIEDVGGRVTLAALYDKPSIDWFSRLNSKDYAEELTSYWQGKVTASVDTVSNILTVRVRGYTADDAQFLAQKLVSSSEALINRISRRSREDALRRAQEEVARSMSELADARLQLLTLQQATGSIDPAQSAKQLATLISTLTLQKIQLESQLAVSDSTGVKGRPGDRYVQSSLDVINAKIQDLEVMLTGDKASSVSMQLKDFELLKLRQEFAEQIYTLSRASYEEARRNAEKQQLYLVVVVPPFRPDYALFPRVFLDTLLVLLGCLVLWAIGALLVASVRDSTEL